MSGAFGRDAVLGSRHPLHRSNSHPGVSMSSNEDDRNIAFVFFQPGLQLHARHLRHADVDDQARGTAGQIGFEEFFRGSKASCDQPSRLHKVAQRILHGLIVINDRNQSGHSVHRHVGSLTPLLHLEQSNFRLTEPDFRRLDPYCRQSSEGGLDSRKADYVMDLSQSECAAPL